MLRRTDSLALGLGLAAGTAAALASIGAAQASHPNLDSLILIHFAGGGWAPMSHREGHNGEGPSNLPVYYGGVAVAPAGFDGIRPWNQGFDACGGSTPRWTNMQAAASASKSSTTGKPELPDWPSGLLMSTAGCGVSPNGHTFMTTYVAALSVNDPSAAGFTYHNPATQSQCQLISLQSPCGDWKTMTEVKKSWWDANRTDFNRRQLMMHEWGHQWGLLDACYSEPSWTHNGLGSCTWPTTLQYQPLDRQALFDIYNN